MNFPAHPFDGLTGVEVCQRIYNPNGTIEEDVREIETLIGGEENYDRIEHYFKPASLNSFPNSRSYKIFVKDINKTLFTINNFGSRIVGGTAFLKLEKEYIFIEATGAILRGLEQLINETPGAA